jgi:fructoselysine 6-kinase
MPATALCLGDHTVDRYVDHGLAYPGGNTVNVAVGLVAHGVGAAWMGQVGDDGWGRWLLDEVAAAGVDVADARVVPGRTSWTEVRVHDGERDYPAWDDGVGRVVLDDERLRRVAAADIVHTGDGSVPADALEVLRDHAAVLSYDFSDVTAEEVAPVAPLADVAVWSCPDSADDQAEDRLDLLLDSGCRVAAVTRGARGCLVADRSARHREPAVAVDVVDTLGAGDAFVAALLAGVLAGASPAALARGAVAAAARACARRGAFGDPVPLTSFPVPASGAVPSPAPGLPVTRGWR